MTQRSDARFLFASVCLYVLSVGCTQQSPGLTGHCLVVARCAWSLLPRSIFETDRRFPFRPGARHRDDRDSALRRSLSPRASTVEEVRFDTADGMFPILEGLARDPTAPPPPQSAPAHQPTTVHATVGYARPRKCVARPANPFEFGRCRSFAFRIDDKGPSVLVYLTSIRCCTGSVGPA